MFFLQYMRSTKEYIQILHNHAEILKSKYGITSLLLFGSVARGEQNDNSDIDVFVNMPPIFYNACAANDYLENILDCHVDLVRNHSNITPFFKQQIEKEGIKIF